MWYTKSISLINVYGAVVNGRTHGDEASREVLKSIGLMAKVVSKIPTP